MRDVKAMIACVCTLLAGCSFGSGSDASEGDDPGSVPDAGSAGTGADAPTTTTGPYPIVLAHGMFGFDHLGPLDYYYGVAAELTGRGRKVFAPRVDPVQASSVRGAQLEAAIDAVLAETGASKVVIIAHSQGGLDARWVAHFAPDKVAAVVTISTPHRGSPVADLVKSGVPGVAQSALSALADFIGVSVSSSDLAAQLDGFSTTGIATFNAEITDSPEVAYFSIAGRSALASSSTCPTTAPFLAKWNDDVDDMAPEIGVLGAMIAAHELPQVVAQDGLVTVDSAKWGTFLGCVPADHLDEVGQVAGRIAGIANPFDYMDMFDGLESYLTAAGY